MRQRAGTEVSGRMAWLIRPEKLEDSHARTSVPACNGGIGGGSGQPSATSVPACDGGIGGGSGQPSATSVPARDGGIGGGSGQPSALNVRSMVTGLPPGSLTDRTTGSTIKTAKTETATASVLFFKGVSLLANRVRRDSFGGVLCLKMFRMRNRPRHEHAYAVPAKPQSHSGLHPDDSGGHSRAICPADLHRFLAGSLQRPV